MEETRARRIVIHLGLLIIQGFIILFLNSLPVPASLIAPVPESQVAGVQTAALSPTPALSTTPIQSPTPQSTRLLPHPESKPSKNSYTIVLIGDSMVESMGADLPYLTKSLNEVYPEIQFNLKNLGSGAINAEQALESLSVQTLAELRPDLIITGTYGYNPFEPYNRDKHWLAFSQYSNELKKITPNIYVLAEISPLRYNFARGKEGLGWEREKSFTYSGQIIELIENGMALAQNLHLNLIDAFNPSLNKSEYVDSKNGIHPSVEGYELMSDKIATGIVLK